MEKDSLFLAFTDGIPDALNLDSATFGNERVINSLNGSESPPAKLLENIERQLCQFIGAADQFDDITLLAVKRNR